METLGRIQKQNLSDQVYTLLKEMIANYRFIPGSYLNLEKLTRDLGVSRTPVWDAIRKLEQEGFVRIEPKKGVMILELTPETAAELYAVRELLEGMAARLAVERIEDGALAEMARCLKEQKKVIEEKDLIGYSRLDFDFHGFISSSCSNKVLQEMLQNIKNKSRPITMLITPILPRLYHDHVEIYKALKQRDGEKAERAVRNHCRNMLKKIKEDTKTGNWVKKNFPVRPMEEA
jgi:DNA-binding GntR family transcriptional regulator